MFFLPSCKEVSRLVSESMDCDLPFWRRFSVRLHLLMCSLCSRFRHQILFLRDAGQSLGEASAEGKVLANTRLSPEARARIKQALEQENQ